jgi:hypothetical protein
MKELIKYAAQMASKYPSKLNEINDLLQLCKDEIDQGGSESHEIELCAEDIKQTCEDDE